jgi:hydrogenase maturation protein HypF
MACLSSGWAIMTVETLEIRVRGRVQGVGFRPNVFRIARELGLSGEVLNDNEGVLIRA